MKNKKASVKSINSLYPSSYSNTSETSSSSRLSQQWIAHYKNKSEKLEKEYEHLLEELDKVKCACDFSNDLQRELTLRNDEVYKLQEIVGDLQVHLFREKEQNVKLNAENDQLKIQDFENKKRINALIKMAGVTDKKILQFTTTAQDKFVPSKLPPKLQKMKEAKQKELSAQTGLNKKGNLGSENEMDPQVLMLYNQSLTSELNHHIKISKEQVDALLKEKEIACEERKIERRRLQKEIDILSSKLKQAQDTLCETTGKLIKLQQAAEKDKTSWMEEKEKYVRTIDVLKEREGQHVPDVLGYCVSGVGSSRSRIFNENETIKEKIIHKEQLAAFYQEQINTLEAEVCRLRERAHICRTTFKEKTEKMTAQVSYLKNKYEDLDRRRQLEAEGFRTDIRMLRDRLKELEKKLSKQAANSSQQSEQQLLMSARNTLNRAKQLEKELTYMKSKIAALESNEEISGS